MRQSKIIEIIFNENSRTLLDYMRSMKVLNPNSMGCPLLTFSSYRYSFNCSSLNLILAIWPLYLIRRYNINPEYQSITTIFFFLRKMCPGWDSRFWIKRFWWNIWWSDKDLGLSENVDIACSPVDITSNGRTNHPENIRSGKAVSERDVQAFAAALEFTLSDCPKLYVQSLWKE